MQVASGSAHSEALRVCALRIWGLVDPRICQQYIHLRLVTGATSIEEGWGGSEIDRARVHQNMFEALRFDSELCLGRLPQAHLFLGALKVPTTHFSLGSSRLTGLGHGHALAYWGQRRTLDPTKPP